MQEIHNQNTLPPYFSEEMVSYFVNEQILCLQSSGYAPNDIIEEYTGRYPDKAGWDDVAEIITDFYHHNVAQNAAKEVACT